MSKKAHPFGELAELHAHMGASVDAALLWEIAHDQGIKIPVASYWEFEQMITAGPQTDNISYHNLFDLTQLVQSSPEAISRCAYSIAAGAYRANNITTIEMRVNPMRRNRGGERDLDHIIQSAIHGIERAMLAYPTKAGLIFELDRRFSKKQNEVIAEKAIKYAGQRVVGIDVSGPLVEDFEIDSIVDVMKDCRKAGLGITIHTGEDTGSTEMAEVVEKIKPDRIGHGVQAAQDNDIELLKKVAEQSIVLEVCPTSNIGTKLVKDLSEFKTIFERFEEHGVQYTINTDGPEMFGINLVGEYSMLQENNVLSSEQLDKATKTAHAASFIK